MIAEPGREHRSAHGCLPHARQRLLLQAVTAPQAEARTAWLEWRSGGGLKEVDPASDRLLLWVFHRRELLELSAEDRAILEPDYRRVWMRNQILLNRTGALVEALRARGVESILLKGVSLLSEVYGDEGGRYLEDFDLLVREEQVAVAVECLQSQGWKLPPGEALAMDSSHAQGFRNGEGLSCDLHWSLFRRYLGAASDETVWSASRTLPFRGSTARVLSIEHQLVHLCVHSMAWEPVAPIRWILDVHLLLQRHPVDWEHVFEAARRWGVGLPLLEALTVLGQVIPGTVPGSVLDRLSRLPVSEEQRRRYTGRVTMPSPGSIFRGMYQDWCNSRRDEVGAEGEGSERLGFLEFLRRRWKVRSLWMIPMGMVERIRRRWFSIDFWR